MCVPYLFRVDSRACNYIMHITPSLIIYYCQTIPCLTADTDFRSLFLIIIKLYFKTLTLKLTNIVIDFILLVHRTTIHSGHPAFPYFAMDARTGERVDSVIILHFTKDERVYASIASSSRRCYEIYS